MSDWGATAYGDPCAECGFAWTRTVDDALAAMAALPATYGDVLGRASGNERHPDLDWPVCAYVSHVADNLRIWTERLMGVVLGASPVVGAYDESELARARNYALIPLEAALWSLRQSTGEWLAAVAASKADGTVLIHPQRGKLDLAAVVLSNTHDAHHHLWDIERTLSVTDDDS